MRSVSGVAAIARRFAGRSRGRAYMLYGQCVTKKPRAGACQQCHNEPVEDLRAKVDAIQTRTVNATERAGEAMTDMLDAIMEAKASGATDEQLKGVYDLQRKAMWRLDYISSENSQGFHADQEAMRILAESIDYSRRAQAMALRLRASDAPSTENIPTEPVEGVTDRDDPPAAEE